MGISKILLIILLSWISLGLYAQENPSPDVSYDLPNNIIKTNPLTPIWGPIILTGEYRAVLETRLALKQSLQIGASYLDKSLYILASEDEMYDDDEPRLIMRGYRVQLSYRLYFTENDFTGLYLSPMVSYSAAKFSFPGYLNKFYLLCTHMNVNFLLGYQYEWTNSIFVDIFSGLGIRQNVWQEYNLGSQTIVDDPEGFYPYKGAVKLTLGFNLGYCF